MNEEELVYSFDEIRKEVHFEQGLLNQRVGWLVTSQSFLFAPLAIGMKDADKVSASAFFPLIPNMGVAICIFALFGIFAAIIRINDWKYHQYKSKDNKQPKRPALFYIKCKGKCPLPSFALPLLGFMPAIGLPLVLLFGWLYILICG